MSRARFYISVYSYLGHDHKYPNVEC